jgi:uncharacterized membrane protein YphA (DoxX/SURF4 family)
MGVTGLLERARKGTEVPAWKSGAGLLSAIVLALIFLVSGLWKVLDPFSAAERMIQSLVPASLSMPAALAAGIFETFAGVLLLTPRYRRWGAALAGAMLIAFMIYIGAFYNRLLGDDCNCFPWIRRVVGPVFFITDALMLVPALGAAFWSRKPSGLRIPAVVLALVAVFSLSVYGIRAAGRTGLRAPDSIAVDGQRFSLGAGRILLYFFDPECSHCLTVAREMSRQQWQHTEIIAVPTVNPQFAGAFLRDAGLQARVSSDSALLRKTFTFTDPPYAVALFQGRQAASFNSGELERAVYPALKRLGFIR